MCRWTGEKRGKDPSPSVMVFSGHMIDSPTRKPPRFPPELEHTVTHCINEHLVLNKGKIAYAAAASGGDIIFLEQMLSLHGEINIILPVSPADFKEQSVAPAGRTWSLRFERLLAHAATVQILGPYSPTSFKKSLCNCNLHLCKLATTRARKENMQVRGLTVLDSTQPGHLTGGTASMISLWQQQNIRYSCIFLNKLRSKNNTGNPYGS